MRNAKQYVPSPAPWRVKRTGSDIAILDRDGGTVIKKVVSQLSMEQYGQLSRNFDFIVDSSNRAAGQADCS